MASANGERSNRPTAEPTEPGSGSLFAIARVTPMGGLVSLAGRRCLLGRLAGRRRLLGARWLDVGVCWAGLATHRRPLATGLRPVSVKDGGGCGGRRGRGASGWARPSPLPRSPPPNPTPRSSSDPTQLSGRVSSHGHRRLTETGRSPAKQPVCTKALAYGTPRIRWTINSAALSRGTGREYR